MGGRVQLDTDDYSCWTGGRPRSDWSGLDSSSPGFYTSPNQLRVTYASGAQKGYNYQKRGPEVKHTMASDIIEFQ